VDNVNPNWLWYACGIVGMLSVIGYLILHRIHHPVAETEAASAEIPTPA